MAKAELDTYDVVGALSTGAALAVEGEVKASPAKGQTVELAATRLELVGACPAEGPDAYPLQKKRHSLEFLRNMRRPPQPIYVFRAGAWELIMSSDLLPGDVCSLAQSPPTPALYKARGLRARVPAEGTERLVPCNMVVLRGSLVVNEAMLTGESVPQRKESLASVEDLRQTLQLGERDAQLRYATSSGRSKSARWHGMGEKEAMRARVA